MKLQGRITRTHQDIVRIIFLAPCLGEADIIVSMFSAVWSEIFSENDFSVMAARGCIDLYTCPSTSEIHHTTSNLVFSYCLTISLGR